MSRLLSAWVALIVFICELFLWAFHAFLAKHFILLMFSIFCHVQTAHHPQDKSLYYISSSPYFNHSLILYLLFSRAVLLSKIQVLKIASLVLQSYISQNIHPLFFPSFFSNLSKNATLYKCVLSFSEWTSTPQISMHNFIVSLLCLGYLKNYEKHLLPLNVLL